MSIQDKNIIKICSFYVSDWHLVTMLLPYINNKINEDYKIITFLENDISNNIEILVNKLNLKNQKKILEINWNKIDNINSNNIKEILDKYIKNDVLIISNGSKIFIEDKNKKIDTYLAESIGKSSKNRIKIIDCYNILEFNENINDILDKHDKMLNTSGEKEIIEVFEDYEKSKKIV